jgi:hypothetical protein
MNGQQTTGTPQYGAPLPATAFSGTNPVGTPPYYTGSSGILCQASTALNKTGALMVASPEPSDLTPQTITVTRQGESYQAIFLGVEL